MSGVPVTELSTILLLLHVVREPLVIAVTVRKIGTDVLVDARLLLGKNLSFAHVWRV